MKTIPDTFIIEIWKRMAQCPKHVFMILTKRPKRMFEFVTGIALPQFGILPNIWLGCMVVNQQEADEKIPILRSIPAAVRFVSVEPMLEQIDLCLSPGFEISAPYGNRGIHWVIAGGESGPGARPMKPEWAVLVKDQCISAGVPFFFKNHGSYYKLGKLTSRLLEGRIWNELPEVKK